MDFNTVVFRDDQDDLVHMFLLDENFKPTGMPSICVSDRYDEELVHNKFFITNIELVPNRRFDGKFEVIGDFDKFDYLIKSKLCFEVAEDKDEEEEEEEKDFTVHQMIRDGKFWEFVDYLVEEHEIISKFEDEDAVNSVMTEMKKQENEGM